jgi:hypothetical protein
MAERKDILVFTEYNRAVAWGGPGASPQTRAPEEIAGITGTCHLAVCPAAGVSPRVRR